MKIYRPILPPNSAPLETGIVPLLNADQIFAAERDLMDSLRPGESLYLSHYSLPLPHEGPAVGTTASQAQREMLDLLLEKIGKSRVKAFLIADNSDERTRAGAVVKRNEESLQYLHAHGACALSYPSKIVSINHTKFMSNGRQAIVTSANLSVNSADAPDDNTGFLLTGPAVHNGIVHAFLPQWKVSVSADERGWAGGYPAPEVEEAALPDEKVAWLNTAPKEENGGEADSTEIFDAYRALIDRAAAGCSGDSLYFEHFDVSNLILLRHILYAHHANPGMDIRFILDPNQYLEGMRNNAHDARAVAFMEVKDAGIPLRFAKVLRHPNGSQDPQRFHDKYVVYNEETVVNGSGNFSNHSLNGSPGVTFGITRLNGKGGVLSGKVRELLDLGRKRHNREVDVLVRDADSARALKEKFLNDWSLRSVEDPNEAAGEGLKGPMENT